MVLLNGTSIKDGLFSAAMTEKPKLQKVTNDITAVVSATRFFPPLLLMLAWRSFFFHKETLPPVCFILSLSLSSCERD